MNPCSPLLSAPIALVFISAISVSIAQQASPPKEGPSHSPHLHFSHGQTASVDNRTAVHFPPPLREHLLSNMRDHLEVIHQINTALADERFQEAGTLAEQRLGMSSLTLHGAHESAKYMPQAMQEIGTTMHRSASQFAIVAQNAAVSGDVKSPLRALTHITANCVACHTSFRLTSTTEKLN
jgi:hypothetical protein